MKPTFSTVSEERKSQLIAEGRTFDGKAIVGEVSIINADGSGVRMLKLADGSEIVQDADGDRLTKWADPVYPQIEVDEVAE